MSASTTASEASSEDAGRKSAPDATLLAADRTRLAFERTMMAWVRTATSLITFGFTVYKFFQFEAGSREPVQHLIGPREFALIMISIGILSLLLATLQQRQSMRSLRAHYVGMRIPRSLAALVGAMIGLLGVLALLAVILRR